MISPPQSGVGAAGDRAYRPEIDGLRAVSIACVLLFHLGVGAVPGGYVGVDVFFVISGFLITRIILSGLDKGSFSFADFYTRRAKRILPPLFVILAAASAFALLLLTPKELSRFTEQALHAVFQISNFHFAEKVGYFEIDRTPSALLHTWSLGVEEQFYLFWPLLLWFCLGPHPRIRPERLFAMVIGLSFALAAFAIGDLERFVFYHLPPRAWELAIGGALALASVAKRVDRVFASAPLREGAVWIGLGMIVFAAASYDKNTVFPAWTALPPVLGAALVIAATGAGPTLGGRLLSLGPITGLGLISYSVYLWHWPMIIFAKLYYAERMLSPTQMMVIGVASILAGWLSWRFVERPTRRASLSGRRTAIAYGGAAAALAVVIAAGGSLKDASWRFVEPAGASAALFGPETEAKHCIESNQTPRYEVFDKKCNFGPAAPGYAVLLWGDSHAHHYFPAVRDWAAARGLTVRLVSLGGCPPFLNAFRYFVRDKEQERCRRNREYILDSLQKNDGVQYVFFALRFSTYFRRDDRFSNQYLLDEQSTDDGVEASHAAFERSMRRTLEIVRGLGATPVILGEAPRLARNPAECVRRGGVLLRRLLPLENVESCGAFNRAYNAGVKAQSDAAMRRAATEGGAIYFDAAAHLPNGFSNGVYLYSDDNHLTTKGALSLRPFMTF
jgi:peptidoglycan/LPS O-acetylase OafA/YrhL